MDARVAASQPIPQPRPRPLIGNVPDVGMKTPVQRMVQLSKQYGPIYKLAFPGADIHVISSEELVAEACDETRFAKKVHGPLREIRAFAGDGLFTAFEKEPNWGKAHRILMPAFGPMAMRTYFDDMLDIADQMLVKWERLGPDAVLDVPEEMTRLTLDTIALCGFGYRFNSFYQTGMHPFVDAMVRGLAEAGARGRRLPIQTKLMRGTRRQFEADTRYMHKVTDDVIAARRKADDVAGARDLLALMLNARDPLTGEKLDDENIRYQLVTFLIAGHETTSGLLSFAVHKMLENPDIMAKARAEADRVLGDGMPRFEHVAKLQYADQILREALRLYPTAPAFAVQARHDTVFAGKYEMKRGAILLALLPALHRDPKVWADPEKFDPERFAPAARASIPEHAWKPFGNGDRACIGRAFALQEAALVLAMLVQRFEIWRPGPYELDIKETLTWKPEGLTIRARARQKIVRAATPAAAPASATGAAPAAPVASHGTPLLILYGSNSGASEAFARRIASDGDARGYRVHVAPLDDYAGKLPGEGAAVIVTSSYNGQPPDNARAFAGWLDHLRPGLLSHVTGTIFGCGNRDWGATYQEFPKRLETLVTAAGARVFLPRGEADARGDFFGDFETWYAPFWDELGKAMGIAAGGAVEGGPLYGVEMVPSAAADLVRAKNLALATITENRELVDMTSPLGRSKRHIGFTLPEGMTYAAGDYLIVLPENDAALVERAARRFGLRPDAAMVLTSRRGASAASLPTDKPVSVGELLGRHVELAAPATRKDIEKLAAANVCPPHKAHLDALAADPAKYKAEILDKRVSVLDLLEDYMSCETSFAAFLEMLPAMRVRQYSISSSPLADPAACSLTVAVVDAPAWSGKGQFKGAASSYLAGLQPGDRVPVSVGTPNVPFHPPRDNATPVILIGAGTGLAPFRGFIADRANRHGRGEPSGDTHFFFGCDHPDVDFLYRAELQAYQKRGRVQLHTAFFRAPEGDITFVQHRLWAERALVKDLLDRGAAVFVCGDGQRMYPAVRETLEKIHADATGGTADDGRAWLTEMERNGRFVADVFA
ncbi:MAG: cytochrome P450 [Micropepsaceae bacterium]